MTDVDRKKLSELLSLSAVQADRDNYPDEVRMCDESSLGEFMHRLDNRSGGISEENALKEPGSGGIYMKAVTGGYEGGNCWGDDSHYFVREEGISATFDVLDTFVENHVPSMPFGAYRRLLGLVERDEMTEYEYYGNCTNYNVFFLAVEKLASFLENEGLNLDNVDQGDPRPLM